MCVGTDNRRPGGERQRRVGDAQVVRPGGPDDPEKWAHTPTRRHAEGARRPPTGSLSSLLLHHLLSIKELFKKGHYELIFNVYLIAVWIAFFLLFIWWSHSFVYISLSLFLM